MLIFVLQTIWLYIKELAGKDLDVIVIAKFLLYFSPKLIPLVLPLTILLASIMVFGNFAENYEFAAMKSTGISLQRAMTGLSIFIVGLGITTFFFSNNVIPWGEYNSYNLRKNIAKLKPAMVIAPGQFNDIGNINIKVAEKSGDRGQYLKNVIIHQKTSRSYGNYRTIKSKTGELKGAKNSEILQLILYDGNFYDDTPPKKIGDKLKHPFSKGHFEKYIINVDLTQFNIDLEEKNISDTYKMLNVSDLNYTIDSLTLEHENDIKEFSTNLYNRTNVSQLNIGVEPKKDSINEGSIISIFNTKKKVQLLELALNNITSTLQIIKTKDTFFKVKKTMLNRHIIALHEKFALGFACVILFFVGAPLGALIRKGGIGLPMVIAILLFLTYHFIGIFATNSAKNGTINPTIAPWLSTIIMLPLGVFLTRRATADRGLFEFDHIIEPIKKVFNFKSTSLISNIDESEIYKFHIIIKTKDLEAFKKTHFDYKDHAKFSYLFYCVAIILFILYFVFKNNKLLSLASASIQLCSVSTFIYLIYYTKSYFNIKSLYRFAIEKRYEKNLFMLLLGFIFYPITHLLIKNKIAEDFTVTLK